AAGFVIAAGGGQAVVVPFADEAAPISGLSHGAGPERGGIGDFAAKVEDAVAESGATGEEFGPAGRTDGIGAGGRQKRRALRDQTVQMARADAGVPQSANRIGALIVTDEEQHVGAAGLCRSRGGLGGPGDGEGRGEQGWEEQGGGEQGQVAGNAWGSKMAVR